MKKIIIIDDENYVNRLVQFNLTEDGYEIITALTGQDGLRLIEEKKPDLIILDIAMPGVDGFMVLERLKGSEELRNIPVLILTAKVMDEVEQKAMDMGADAFITKPFSPAELSKKVKEFF